MKVIYFDEGTATDYLKIINNGLEVLEKKDKKGSDKNLGIGAKLGIGPAFSRLFETFFSGETSVAGRLSHTSEKYIEKTLTSAILSDFKTIADKEDFITRFSNYSLNYIPNSIAHFQTIAPYLSMMEGKLQLDNEISIDISKMHKTLEFSKGYYEMIAENENEEVIFRFNNKAFSNNYSIADLSQMKLTLYGVNVGEVDKNKLDFQSAIQSFENQDRIITSISEEDTFDESSNILEMYDIILAGIDNNDEQN